MCLDRVIAIVRQMHARPRTQAEQVSDWNDLSDAMDDLATWLRNGGFPPQAAGPIFGLRLGMLHANSQDRSNVWHVCAGGERRWRRWRYAIFTEDACRSWKMREYQASGDVLHQWVFPQPHAVATTLTAE